MRRLLLLLLVFTTGCFTVPALTTEGQNVTVTSNNQLTVGCTFLGEIQAPDLNEVGDSKNELANKAAEMQRQCGLAHTQNWS